MEVWSLIHKETKKLIRFSYHLVEEDWGEYYYFVTNEQYYPIWVVDNEENALKAISKNVCPYTSSNYNSPDTSTLNDGNSSIFDYEVIKLTY